MNHRIDAPREHSFLVRFLLVLPFGVLLSTQIGCADDAQQPVVTDDSSITERLDALEDQVAGLQAQADRVDQLETRVHSLELQHLVAVADQQRLQLELDMAKSQLDPFVKTFTFVGAETPDPYDTMVYVNGSLNLGINDLLVRNIGASNVNSDQATFGESWTLGAQHVESLAFKQDNYERFMYGFDLEWIHQISPFTLSSYDENGESVITFTSGHVRVNNLRAYNQLRGDTLYVDTYGAMPELNVWNRLVTGNLEAFSVEVKELLNVLNEASFGFNDTTGPAVTITRNGLASGMLISSPSQVSYSEKAWLFRASQLVSFGQSNGDGTWSMMLEDAKLVARRGMSVSNENDNWFNPGALVVHGDSKFKQASDGTPADVTIEGSLNVTGAADTGCLQTEVDSCIDLQ